MLFYTELTYAKKHYLYILTETFSALQFQFIMTKFLLKDNTENAKDSECKVYFQDFKTPFKERLWNHMKDVQHPKSREIEVSREKTIAN